MLGSGLRAGLETSLFPTSPPRARSWRHRAAALLLVGAAAGVQLLRLPGALDTIWAEDGRVFLQQARDVGRLHAYALPYAGYLHVIPRTVAAIVASFPLRWAAALLAVVPAIAVGALALFIFNASRGHLASPRWRLLLAGTLVFLPIAGVELLDNGVNLQWYAMCAMFWALLWRPSSVAGRSVAALLCLAAAMSDPLTVLFLPLVAARLVAVRDWREQSPVAAWAVGLLVQLGVALHTTVPHSTDHASALTLARLFLLRVATPFFLGDHEMQSAFARAGWTLVAIFATLLLALVVVATHVWRRRMPPRAAWLGAAALATAVLFFAVPVQLRWTPLYVPVGNSPTFLELGSRYTAVPLIALWSAAMVTVAAMARSAAAQIAGGALLIMLATMWAFDFSASDSTRNLGPRWSEQLAVARAHCSGGQSTQATLLIPPPNGEWTVTVPCADVLP